MWHKPKLKLIMNKKLSFTLILIILARLFTHDSVFSQNEDVIRIVFWNMENFFDPYVDSTRSYNEYTENGIQHWTLSRFYRKRNNVYKTILSLSKENPLAIIGICEIENTFVSTMLFHETPLKRYNYRVIHYEGDDRRGIDVALAYSLDELQLVSSEAIKVRSPDDKNFRSRDILYAKFYDKEKDTLHCFVNHWPSRYGGEKETMCLRDLAASTLKTKVDSLMKTCEDMPKIIIMGDFNDTPQDNSISNVLEAKSIKAASNDDCLINLFYDARKLGFEGTLKHKHRWQTFDQIIISKSLIDNNKSLHYIKNSATIFHDDFLFVDDDVYGGKKLFRTYLGPKYQGGYSDHLPVYIDLRRH